MGTVLLNTSVAQSHTGPVRHYNLESVKRSRWGLQYSITKCVSIYRLNRECYGYPRTEFGKLLNKDSHLN